MKSLLCVILILFQLVLTSCNSRHENIIPSDGAESNEAAENTGAISCDIAPVSNGEIIGIETVPYPNPQAVSEYATLTDDQKIAYDAIGNALVNVLNGSLPVGGTYQLERRVSWYDYQLAYNIFAANYTVLEKIIVNLLSQDSLGTQDYTDAILFFDDGFVSEFCRTEYPELCVAADSILNSLTYDGTECGKAFAIAKWLADNVTYATGYMERSEDSWIASADGPILKKEAVCSGYSKAYDFLCKRAGLEIIYVDSSEQMHVWNMICIDNAWYHIDTTWMESPYYLDNFMISDEACYRLHGEAQYYCIPKTLEKVIPEAPHCSSYGYLVFDNAESALEYFSQYKPTDEIHIYFSSIDEKDKFLAYNNKYISTSDIYLSVRSLFDNIVTVS